MCCCPLNRGWVAKVKRKLDVEISKNKKHITLANANHKGSFMDSEYEFIYEIRARYDENNDKVIFYLYYGIEPDELTELVYNIPINEIKKIVKYVKLVKGIKR